VCACTRSKPAWSKGVVTYLLFTAYQGIKTACSSGQSDRGELMDGTWVHAWGDPYTSSVKQGSSYMRQHGLNENI
jgi:hypothetical protein